MPGASGNYLQVETTTMQNSGFDYVGFTTNMRGWYVDFWIYVVGNSTTTSPEVTTSSGTGNPINSTQFSPILGGITIATAFSDATSNWSYFTAVPRVIHNTGFMPT